MSGYTDADYRRDRRRVDRVFREWLPRLGLIDWRIDTSYVRGSIADADPDGVRTFARVTARWEYREACIEVCMPMVEESDDDELEYRLVHELCHVLVNQMRDAENRENNEEHVVVGLAVSLRRAYRDGLLDGRKEARHGAAKRPRRVARPRRPSR